MSASRVELEELRVKYFVVFQIGGSSGLGELWGNLRQILRNLGWKSPQNEKIRI